MNKKQKRGHNKNIQLIKELDRRNTYPPLKYSPILQWRRMGDFCVLGWIGPPFGPPLLKNLTFCETSESVSAPSRINLGVITDLFFSFPLLSFGHTH